MSLLPHKILKLRQRHIFTRSNGLRLRYVAGFVALGIAGLVSVALPSSSSLTLSQALSRGGEPVVVDVSDYNKDTEANLVASNDHLSGSIKAKLSNAMRDASSVLKKAEKIPFKRVAIGQGDTIAGVLKEAGLSNSESYYAVKALSEHFEPRRVKSGQKIGVHYVEDKETGEMVFDKLSMKITPVKQVTVQKSDDETYTASLEEKELERKTYGRFAKIETSLYGSAARADIPSAVIADMIRIYSWDIDFQRDIRSGDKIEVLYEAFETDDGDYTKYGDVLYASLSVGGKAIPVYRYEMKDGRVDYFERDGTSVRKTLMKTPVDGARISSGFGMRHHPVLGYNKMHKGMDFAAPTGTPIYAAGDGVIDFMGRKGGYGNYIRIRHNSKLKTAYAHMHKFNKKMGNGKRVEQGDIIGYVGTTGRSTGPHLHYEVLLNGKQVNPRSVDLPTGEILEGIELARFKAKIKDINQKYASETRGFKFAVFGDPDNG